jgi:hypothetical protein
MSEPSIDRRRFLKTAAGSAALAAGLAAGCGQQPEQKPLVHREPEPDVELVGPPKPYDGPNLVLIRFGGGVRRLETVLHPDQTFCPFVYHELGGKQGIIYEHIDIASAPGIDTSHGQGTLYLLTGRYDHYEDITNKPFADRFEAKVPTLFEYLRKHYYVPEHQALIINGEDRINEEFYTFSNHHLYGVHYKSTVLSLYRFKTYLLRKQLEEAMPDQERAAKLKQLHEMESKDYRVQDRTVTSPELDAFWSKWEKYYGRSGLVNPRGDRLLTELALWSLRELQPRLLMINYQDPDYVHWGNPNFYTRAISIIDDGVRQIHDAVQANEFYRDSTVFVIVPDCGRDNNRCMSVPYQHHFNSKSAHQIFAVLAGPEKFISRSSTPVTGPRQQIDVARTVGHLMGFSTQHVDGDCLEEAIA